MENEKGGFFEYANLQFMPDLSMADYTSLNLKHNNLHAISSESLPRTCKVFLLGHNQLAADGLPDEWPDRTETINLSYNSIQTTEETIWPAGLKELYLNENPLENWPARLPHSLHILNVSESRIHSVDSIPAQLRRLEANSCRIKQIPTSFPDSLESLFLYDNLLRNSRLPFEWSANLKVLDLTRNALTKFPEGLPDTLETLYLNDNKITELAARLPLNLVTLLIESNQLRKVTIEARRKPLHVFSVANNQLLVSVRQIQQKKGITFANSIREVDNWYEPVFDVSVRIIQKAWKVYRIKKTLRVFLKTARVKEELQQVSMHPCRAGRYENISPEWGEWSGWGC